MTGDEFLKKNQYNRFNFTTEPFLFNNGLFDMKGIDRDSTKSAFHKL